MYIVCKLLLQGTHCKIKCTKRLDYCMVLLCNVCTCKTVYHNDFGLFVHCMFVFWQTGLFACVLNLISKAMLLNDLVAGVPC